MIAWTLWRLQSKNPDTRKRAAHSLSALLKPRIFRALATASNDVDAQVRETAQQSLRAIYSRLKSEGADKASRFLVKVLKKGDDRVRAAAVEPLIQALKDSSAYGMSRPVAARHLGEIGDPLAVPALIAAFDGSSEAERTVADALAKIGGNEALDALVQKLDDILVHNHLTKKLLDVGPMSVRPTLILQLVSKESWAREDAERILRTVNPNWPQSVVARQALPNLIDKCAFDDYSQRKAALKAVERIEPHWWKSDAAQSSVPALMQLLKSNGIGAQDDAVELLVSIGTAAVDPLIVALKDSNYRVRHGAAEALVKIGDAAVDPLIATLNNSDKDVFRTVAEVLGKIGNARAVDPLIAALKNSDKDVRGGAVNALKALKHQPENETQTAVMFIANQEWDKAVKLGGVAVEPLIVALKDLDRDVCLRAAEALGKIGDGRAVEPLIAVLLDSDEGKRRGAAAWALGKIGDARVVEPLIKALGDGDADVRFAAADALAESEDPRVVGSPSVRDLILEIKRSHEISQRLRSSAPHSRGSSDSAMLAGPMKR